MKKIIIKMKKIIIAVIFSLFVATSSWATYTGSITGGDTLFGADGWSDAALNWEVGSDNDVWTYNYTFAVSDKAISHLLFEVSDTFTADNILAGTSPGYQLGVYDSSNGNPGIPASVFGLKWDFDVETTSASITIVTDRSPMWGDFYAKDGTDKTTDGFVYAYNTEFGNDTLDPLGNGNAGGWVMVPDTGSAPVPEPGTMLLLGAGLLGLAGVGRKKRGK